MEFNFINKNYKYEYQILKSKFISILMPISDIDNVNSLLNEIKIQYPKASHYIYAYIIDNNYYYTDNGEPSNTAGKPTYEVLKSFNLNNVILITIRYFGGTKLGSSNLLRTYLFCAKKVCENLIFLKKEIVFKYEIEINKEDFKTFQNFIVINKGKINKIIYNINTINLNVTINDDLKKINYLKSLKILNIKKEEILIKRSE